LRVVEYNLATNPAITFRVASFTPSDDFKPAKPFQTRITWRDPNGASQSKLLLTKPEAVIAIALRGETELDTDRKPRSRRPSRASRRRVMPRGETLER
jgi:hypothetical protein